MRYLHAWFFPCNRFSQVPNICRLFLVIQKHRSSPRYARKPQEFSAVAHVDSRCLRRPERLITWLTSVALEREFACGRPAPSLQYLGVKRLLALQTWQKKMSSLTPFCSLVLGEHLDFTALFGLPLNHGEHGNLDLHKIKLNSSGKVRHLCRNKRRTTHHPGGWNFVDKPLSCPFGGVEGFIYSVSF